MEQMEFLKSSSIEVISLDRALITLFSEGQPQKDQVVLTFDDGCESFYDVAHPILEKYGFPATITQPLWKCIFFLNLIQFYMIHCVSPYLHSIFTKRDQFLLIQYFQLRINYAIPIGNLP